MKTFSQLTVGDRFFEVYKNKITYQTLEVSKVDGSDIYYGYAGGKIPRFNKARGENAEWTRYPSDKRTYFYFTEESEVRRYCKAQMMKELNSLIESAKKKIEKEKQIVLSNNIKPKEYFKNWSKEDKLFKYFCEGKVPENQRKNDILFKNFAIALVNEGKNINEIQSLIEPILKKYYQDKTFSEFKGWVERAMKNELDNYNIFELNQWSRNFNHPVFYEDIKGVEDVGEIMGIKQLWYNLWDCNIVEQDIWRDLCLYNLIGTIIDEKELDDLKLGWAVIVTESGLDNQEIAIIFCPRPEWPKMFKFFPLLKF